jgi:hypothetical protein
VKQETLIREDEKLLASARGDVTTSDDKEKEEI